MIIPPGTTAFSIDVQIVDDVGLPQSGLDAAAFPPVYVSLGGDVANVAITLSDLPSITTPHPNNNTAGGIYSRGGGYYRLDLPNSLFSAPCFPTIIGEATNKHLIAPRLEVAYGPGGGAYTFTVTVDSSVSNTPAVQGAYVRLTNGAFSVVQQTNASGVATFNLDPATYVVGITAAGYSFGGASLVVTGNGNQNYLINPLSVPISPPGQATGQLLCYDVGGALLSGVVITCKLQKMPGGNTGTSSTIAARTATSNGAGLVTLAGLWQGAVYTAQRGSGDWVEFYVPTDAATFNLPDVLGIA